MLNSSETSTLYLCSQWSQDWCNLCPIFVIIELLEHKTQLITIKVDQKLIQQGVKIHNIAVLVAQSLNENESSTNKVNDM